MVLVPAEPIFFDENGKIEQVEATSCGLNGGPLEGKGSYPAYIACNLFYAKNIPQEKRLACMTQDIPDVEDIINWQHSHKDDEPVQYLHAVSDGMTAGYKYFQIKEEVKTLAFIIRGKASGRLEIALSEEAQSIGEAFLTCNYEEWHEIFVSVNISKGKQALFFRYYGEGSFDIQQFSFIN